MSRVHSLPPLIRRFRGIRYSADVPLLSGFASISVPNRLRMHGRLAAECVKAAHSFGTDIGSLQGLGVLTVLPVGGDARHELNSLGLADAQWGADS